VAFSALDYAIVVGYMVFVAVLGAVLGRQQKDASDYFLADRSIPWWAACFSLVATETSALTVISVPATAYGADLWMLQLAAGYCIGRIAIAVFLLPRYFRGEIATAYVLLQRRFGDRARRFASLIFLVTRVLADGVRIFATAIPLAVITGLPVWQSVVAIGVFTLLYSYYGGLRAVVWVDVAQLFIYVAGGVAVLWVLVGMVPGGWAGIVAAAEPADKLRIVHPTGGFFADPKWLLTGLVGGAFLTMASHGADHLIVQRLLAAPSLRDARKALIGSGVIVLGQFALFLLIGVGLFAYYRGAAFTPADSVFPRFAVEHLPSGVRGLLVAAVLAAAMSSSLNALAAVSVHDIYVPLTGRGGEAHLLAVGKRFTLLWGVVMIVVSLAFQWVAPGTPLVLIALQIASFTYGGLLGGFLLGLLSKRATERDALAGMAVAVAGMAALWGLQQFGVIGKVLDTLWFALLGSAVTVAVGTLSARLRRPPTPQGSAAPATL
jgi:SSS family transporter